MTRTEPSAVAGRILDFERSDSCPLPTLEPLLRACEKFRGTFSTFMGAQGYDALLRRALTLAKVKAPILSCLCVSHPGILKLQTREGDVGEPLESDAANVDLVGEILDLLLIFIGAPLTQTLVEGIWPTVFRPELSIETKEDT